MVRPVMRLGRCSFVVVLVACLPPRVEPLRTEPPSPPPPPALRVPDGCLALQGGEFVSAPDSRLRALADDDGGVLSLTVTASDPVDAGRPPRRFGRDGGLPWLVQPDGGPAAPVESTRRLGRFVLTRGPGGFLGSFVPSPEPACGPFPAAVVACAPDALELESPLQRASSCEVPDGGWGRLRLLRWPPGDAGLDARPDTLREADGGAAAVAPDP